jgi:hypothetical protein
MKACPECGCVLEKPRSAPHHRRLFGLISAAFANWPESHEFQPDDPEHLRAWLLCRAGYREAREIEVAYSEHNPELAKATALVIQAAIEEAGAYAFIRPHPSGGSVAVYRPRSIAWSRLSQKDFSPLAEAVEGVIESVIGVEAETLLKEHEAAA